MLFFYFFVDSHFPSLRENANGGQLPSLNQEENKTLILSEKMQIMKRIKFYDVNVTPHLHHSLRPPSF